MAKNKRKVVLIGTSALSLVAATGVTSVFAWFAANNEVNANGMSISAVSNAPYLEIKGSEDENWGTTGTNDIDEELKPIAHETWSHNVSSVTNFTNNWYYRYSDDTADGSSGLSDKVYINSFTGYVATCSYQVRIRPEGTPSEPYYAYIKGVSFSSDYAGLRLVVYDTVNYVEFNASANNIAYRTRDRFFEVSSTAQTLNCLIYVDGNDSNVYTDNFSNLTGTISFTVGISTDDTVTMDFEEPDPQEVGQDWGF